MVGNKKPKKSRRQIRRERHEAKLRKKKKPKFVAHPDNKILDDEFKNILDN